MTTEAHAVNIVDLTESQKLTAISYIRNRWGYTERTGGLGGPILCFDLRRRIYHTMREVHMAEDTERYPRITWNQFATIVRRVRH